MERDTLNTTPEIYMVNDLNKTFGSCELGIENEFVNPTPDNPVRVQDLLTHLDLEFLRPVLDEMYAEAYRFKYDSVAMLKTMIYWRLSSKRFLTEVWNDLLTDPTLADNLGFDDIPDYKALHHWLNYRFGKDGVRKIFEAINKEVIKIAGWNDISVGKEQVIDSTPIEKKNMKQASYNPKYEMMCVKYHNLRCAITGIPLDYHITTGTTYDGEIFIPLVYRVITKFGIKPVRIYGDNHYADAINLMRLKEFWGIEVICNIAKNWIMRDKDGMKDLQHEYHRMWKEDGYQPEANAGYMKFFLMMHDKTEVLENFYHNQVMKAYQRNPEAYMNKLKLRDAIEHSQGLEKKHTEIKNIQASNLETFETHIGMHVISRLSLALVRLQNGVSENLVHLGGLV